MQNIFALYGTADVGKTSTIIRAYELLKQQFPAYTVYPPFEDFEQLQPGDDGQDFCVIIIINGKIIGIESQGDPNSRLFYSLPVFARVPCDIILCATRTRGRTVKAVEALAPPYSIDWLEKTHNATKPAQDAASNAMAAELVKRITAVL